MTRWLWLPSTSGTGQCSAPSARWPVTFLRWSECLDLHLNSGYLPGQSYVLVDLLSCRDQVIGAGLSLHPPVAIALLLGWSSPSLDLFVTCLPAVLPLFCSLVPNPQVVFLDAFHVPWGSLAAYAFPPFLSSDGWWLELERPQSLHDWLPPSGQCRSGSQTFPCSYLWFSRFTYVVAKVFSVSPVPGSQSALHSVFALQDLVWVTSLDIFYVP